jgi:hypothetical protein
MVSFLLDTGFDYKSSPHAVPGASLKGHKPEDGSAYAVTMPARRAKISCAARWSGYVVRKRHRFAHKRYGDPVIAGAPKGVIHV